MYVRPMGRTSTHFATTALAAAGILALTIGMSAARSNTGFIDSVNTAFMVLIAVAVIGLTMRALGQRESLMLAFAVRALPLWIALEALLWSAARV